MCIFSYIKQLFEIYKLKKQTLECSKFSFSGRTYICKVVKCYDGDTIHCVFKFNNRYQRFIIRMYGYNSPEIRTKIKKEKLNAIKARDRLSELVLNKIVYLECMDFDKYGRILGKLKFSENGQYINDIMLNEGYGIKY